MGGMIPSKGRWLRIRVNMRFIVLSLLFLSGCATTTPYQIDLMPAPEVYGEGKINPLPETDPIGKIPYSGILYATDRAPAGSDSNERFYNNERGHVLRLGVARIELGKEGVTWEEARRISLLKNRTEEYPMQVTEVDEIGVLDRTLRVLGPELTPAEPRLPAKQFASMVNEKLAISQHKDIYIYVHGYRVIFENPLLVATELWHFLGYEGVFIAYAWPSTPSRFAYMSDLETAAYSARNLRLFLEYLSEETAAEKIHLVGYSAGTRVVINALEQLAIINEKKDQAAINRQLHLGHAILIGSDFDRDLFGGYLEDGLLKISDTLTIYMSESDKALGMARWFFKRPRLGEMLRERQIRPGVKEFLSRNKDLIIIDVTGAEDADAGNGHAYFRQSAWVSSDILMTLMYGLRPEERGLVSDPELPIWIYPHDYISRLLKKIAELNPDM